ncbi:MAG: ATP-binding protein [Bacteroidia bacterium]
MMKPEKEIIKESIVFFRQNITPGIDREVSIPAFSNKVITIIGPRRVGKTHVLLQHIRRLSKHKVLPQHILYLNLEDERINYTQLPPDYILQAYTELHPDVPFSKIHLFLDEIQHLPQWEKFIRRVYDTYTKHIYLTGSNSAFLQHNISTSLRGRTLSYQIFPLSFKEFLRFKNYTYTPQDLYHPRKRSLLLNLFKEYVLFGGFPEPVLSSKELRIKILQEYVNVMLYKDLIEQYHISDLTTLKFFLRRIMDSTGKVFSIHKIYNDLKSANIKVSKNTLYDYLKYLEDVFAVFILPKHFQSPVKTELSERKIYPVDNGYLQAYKYIQAEHYGVMLENTLRQFFLQHEYHLFFFKDNKEVDFVCFDKKNKPHLFQVSYSLHDADTKKREIDALLHAARIFKVKEAYILTMEDEEEITVNKLKIHIMPAYKYILQNS